MPVVRDGYICVNPWRRTKCKEAWRKSFDKETDRDQIRKAVDLPNFSFEIFEEITGISKADFEKKLGENVQEDIIQVYVVKYKRCEE